MGAALVPSAPLLHPDVTPELPAELAALRGEVEGVLGVLGVLAPRGIAVLVAGGPDAGIHRTARADLAGIGRPDIAADRPVPARAMRSLVGATGLEARSGGLGLDLAALALQVDRAVVPIAVDPTADGASLADLGAAIADAAADIDADVVMIGAGDGAASIGDRSPRPGVAGGQEWQETFTAAVDDPAALARLGPEEALRVAARGWAPAVVVAAASRRAGLALKVRTACAPRGVGYVLAAADGRRGS